MIDLSPIEDEWLDDRLKGFPPSAAPVRVRDVASRGWNVLAGDLPVPCAVLRASALDHNLRWMRDFCAEAGVSLAPHGKTTMAPQLFARQLEAGAWAITVATVHQANVAVRCGLRRLVLANQVVGSAELDRVVALSEAHADLELPFLVDSHAQLARVADAARRAGARRPLSVLVEIGHAAGRAGLRSPGEAVELARAIAGSGVARLVGVECFEGLRVSLDAVADARVCETLLADVREVAERCDGERLFGGDEIVVTAGGSALFDVAARGLSLSLSKPVRVVLRSGCYVAHDAGFYERALACVRERRGASWAGREGLRPALELWSQVQSRPEPGLAIVTMGKRDAGFDIDLPRPVAVVRPAAPRTLEPVAPGTLVAAMNDQHGYLRMPPGMDLAVGDLVACGVSHPCTTFDRWALIHLVDDRYDVVGAIRTYF